MTAIETIADLTLSIVHRDTTLTAFDEDHKSRHQRNNGDHKNRRQGTDSTRAHQLEQTGDCRGQSGNDTSEDDDGDTVPQTAFGDLFTEPHQKHRTRHQGNDTCESEHKARIQHEACLAFECDSDTKRLEYTQQQRAIARVLSDLTASRFAFFTQTFKRGEHIGQHLHNNGCRDVRHDPQRKH